MKDVTFTPIGKIHSPFQNIEDMPIQPVGAKGVQGTLEVDEQYTDGLKDLEGFSHIILLYHFHLSEGFSLSVKPFLDDEEKGLFSTRAPKRPGPIGLSVVKLIDVDENILRIEDVDVVDGTPLLDIKPYVPEFDIREVENCGWLEKEAERAEEKRSDERFR